MIAGMNAEGTGKPHYRVLINYQELKAIPISPEYPLPTIQEILDMSRGAKMFTIIDMQQGSNQIRVKPDDQYKTALRTCMGQYEFNVMPFGR